MLTANYHTHTFRCHHGVGEEKEYVEKAIEAGLKTLGFSEHAPYRFLNGYTSWWRLQPDELDDYVQSVLDVRREYRDDIRILLGLETEYYPVLFERLLDDLRGYPLDYMIFGQHAFGNEYNMPGVYAENDSPEYLTDYVDTCIAGLETGLFSYLAHPDLFSFTGSEELYVGEMTRLCHYCSEKHVPLEINMKGVMDHRRYPGDRFFAIASRFPCRYIVGMDAHSPDEVVQPSVYPRFNELVRKFDIHTEEKLDEKPLLKRKLRIDTSDQSDRYALYDRQINTAGNAITDTAAEAAGTVNRGDLHA